MRTQVPNMSIFQIDKYKLFQNSLELSTIFPHWTYYVLYFQFGKQLKQINKKNNLNNNVLEMIQIRIVKTEWEMFAIMLYFYLLWK